MRLAKSLGCDIISADSRQIYKGIPIGTAAPTIEDMEGVVHHFIGILPLEAYYSAARFEEEVLAQLPSLWSESPYVIMCGGSMMYLDAVVNGIDALPDVNPEIRQRAWDIFNEGGLEAIQKEAERLDPVYYATADKANYKRLVHAVEISLQTGRPYSSFLTGEKRTRPFNIVKFGLDMPREQLFDRINRRVDMMIEAGLEEEAARVYPLRHLNSLNTVGYKEMFSWFDGTMDYTTAIERIKKNTRVYAKKQLTWLRRDTDITWLAPDADLLSYLHQ